MGNAGPDGAANDHPLLVLIPRRESSRYGCKNMRPASFSGRSYWFFVIAIGAGALALGCLLFLRGAEASQPAAERAPLRLSGSFSWVPAFLIR